MGAFDIIMAVVGVAVTLSLVVIGVMTFGSIALKILSEKRPHKHA